MLKARAEKAAVKPGLKDLAHLCFSLFRVQTDWKKKKKKAFLSLRVDRPKLRDEELVPSLM